MARLLALEWDAREARVVVARTRGSDALVEHAFAVELAPRDPGQTFADINVGERIAAALAARSIGRCDTLVAVGRANIELRQLTLPPSPLDELPELVRFQALRQFTGIGEDWPLDYVPLEMGEEDSLNVLAAAISPELVEQIRETCKAGELTPRRLVLRPFAAASLLRRRDGGEAQPCRLMVDLLADEADLTVLVDQQVALVRTVRLPVTEDANVQSRALLGEIRRTIAAAHNQLRDRRVERVILCGDGEEHASLQSLVEEELGQDVQSFDPFGRVQLSRELRAQKPSHPGRFAPLLGLLLDEAQGAQHSLDFLHPRKKAEPPSQRRRNSLVVAALAAMALGILFLAWSQFSSLGSDIEELASRSASLEKTVGAAEKDRGDARAVEEFLESDINWLDELYDLSNELPSADDLIVTQLNVSTRPTQGGQIILDGFTREYEHIEDVGRALRTGERQVISTGGQEDERRAGKPWRIKETVMIEAQTSSSSPLPAAEVETSTKDAATPTDEDNPPTDEDNPPTDEDNPPTDDAKTAAVTGTSKSL